MPDRVATTHMHGDMHRRMHRRAGCPMMPPRHSLPYARPGQVIGLLGGSFDPAHAGHVHITRAALRHFALDRVWWLLSPGNPLKTRGPADIALRLAAARHVMQHPRVVITDLEARIGTRATVDTLRMLRRLYPRVRFVWLMGADNLAQLGQWQDWQEIMQTTPIGVLARPGEQLRALTSVAARRHARARLPARAAPLLGRQAAPAWCFVNLPLCAISSSQVRLSGAWPLAGGVPDGAEAPDAAPVSASAPGPTSASASASASPGQDKTGMVAS